MFNNRTLQTHLLEVVQAFNRQKLMGLRNKGKVSKAKKVVVNLMTNKLQISNDKVRAKT
jgi:tryptophanyl-tRNA synthetase